MHFTIKGAGRVLHYCDMYTCHRIYLCGSPPSKEAGAVVSTGLLEWLPCLKNERILGEKEVSTGLCRLL